MANRSLNVNDLALAPIGLLVALIVPIVIASSRPEAPISQYSIAKEPVPDVAGPPPEEKREKTRTIGAIVPHGEKTWFFKLTGPVDPVGKQMRNFLNLLESLSFGARGEPKWTLPEGWTQESGREMRFATLRISGEAPLELSVITLPGDGTKDDYILANVNRWRDQSGLKPVTLENLYNTESKTEETRSLELSGRKIVLVNFVGMSKVGGMGMPPFARARPAAANPDVATADAADADGIKFETPAGWKAGKANAFSKLAFSVADPKEPARTVDVTVSELGGQGGDLLANVNRWRGQVGLPPTTLDDLKKESGQVEVDGTKGTMVELVGKKGDAPETILGVIVLRQKSAWFFKLKGHAALAAAEKERFEEFVKSVKFE